MNARVYDPAIGRFLQADPIGFEGGLNGYGYVEGNPIMLVDPSGLEAEGFGYVDAAKRYMSGQGGIVMVGSSNLMLIKSGPNEGTICCGSDYAVHGNVGLHSDGTIRPGRFNFDQKKEGFYGKTIADEVKRFIRNDATSTLEWVTYLTGAAANFMNFNFNLQPAPFMIKYSEDKPNVIYDRAR